MCEAQSAIHETLRYTASFNNALHISLCRSLQYEALSACVQSTNGLTRFQNIQIRPRNSNASFSSLATFRAEDQIQVVFAMICFALTSFLIRPPSTFHNVFIFTLLTGGSDLLHTHPSVQNTILPNKVLWSALFLSPGSSYLEPTRCFRPSFYLCQFFQIFLDSLSLSKTLSSVPLL